MNKSGPTITVAVCLLSLFAMCSLQPAYAENQQNAALQRQMLADMNQQNIQNLQFQQRMNQVTQQYVTLSSAQKAMHDAIMSQLNNIPEPASRVQEKPGGGGSLHVPDESLQNLQFQQQLTQHPTT